MRASPSGAEAVFISELGMKFREERDSRDWSLLQASQRSGLSFTGYKNLERGVGSCLSTLFRAARGFSFDPFVILEPASNRSVAAGSATCDVCGGRLLLHRIGQCR